MTYVLFLDDERDPDKVTWAHFPRDGHTAIARNYEQFVHHVNENGMPSFVCFDHDLADDHIFAMTLENDIVRNDKVFVDYGPEKTGLDCAKWLVDFCADNGFKFPKYVVHSMNPAGRERILGYIENAREHLDI